MKNKNLLTLFQLFGISLVMIGLSSCSNSKSMSVKSTHPVTIKIMSGNTQTNKIILDPPNTVDVYPGSMVTWIIDPSSNVKNFHIEKTFLSRQIFKKDSLPSSKNARRESAVVDNWLQKKIYSYNIFWKAKDDPEDAKDRKFDPKLAVMPSVISTEQ